MAGIRNALQQANSTLTEIDVVQKRAHWTMMQAKVCCTPLQLVRVLELFRMCKVQAASNAVIKWTICPVYVTVMMIRYGTTGNAERKSDAAKQTETAVQGGNICRTMVSHHLLDFDLY